MYGYYNHIRIYAFHTLHSFAEAGTSTCAHASHFVHTALGDQGLLSLADRFGGVSHALNIGTLPLRQA